MSRLFKARRGSDSSAQQQLPFTNEDASQEDFPDAEDAGTEHTQNQPILNTNRNRSESVVSSSFKTPARSYIHHAGHGHQGTLALALALVFAW